MPTPTYIPLVNTTLTSNTATVAFTGLSGSYSSLIIYFQGAETTTELLRFILNGDSAANYGYSFIESSSTNKSSNANTAYMTEITFGSSYGKIASTNRSSFELTIVDYAVSGKQKGGFIKMNGGNQSQLFGAFRYNNTSAITSISFTNSGTFVSGSVFEIYGVI